MRSFSFRLALSLSYSCAICFPLCRHRELSFSISLIVCVSLRPLPFRTYISFCQPLSCSLARSVLLSLINQRCRPGGGTLVPFVHAHNSRNSIPLALSPLTLYFTQLFNVLDKDLRVAYFAKIDKSTIK